MSRPRSQNMLLNWTSISILAVNLKIVFKAPPSQSLELRLSFKPNIFFPHQNNFFLRAVILRILGFNARKK